MMIATGGLAAACAPAQLTSPPNYSTIGGPTTFTWTQPDLSCINWVKLIVGSQPHASDIATQQVALQAYGDQGTTISINIPTDGRLIYVSLVSAISFNPIYQDYMYMSGVPSVAAPPATPVSTPRISDPTPVVSIATPPPVVSAPPAATNTAVLPRVSVDVLPVITVGQSGAPVNVPPSADTQLPVPQVAPAPSTQTTTVTPGAGTSAANTSAPLTSSSGTTTTSSTSPAASTDDGTIFGIPKTYALIGAAALVLLMMGKK